MCAIWSSTWLVIKEGLQDLPPFTAVATRFTVAAIIFTAIAPILARREGGEAPGIGLTLAQGFFNFAGSYGIVYWGETILPSGLASVLFATFPMMVAILGHFFLPAERLDLRQGAGFLLGFCGVVFLFAEDLDAIGDDALMAGSIFLLAPLLSSIGQVVVKAKGERVSSALLNRNGMVVGALILWSVALGLESPGAVEWTLRGVASVAYLALFGTVIAFGLYFWLLRSGSANGLSLVAYVLPVAALALGTLVADEPFTPTLAGGTALVLAGCALAAKKRRPKPAAAS